jgi:hypothetical protein
MVNMIYCFDLDGTLCDTEGSDYESALPKQERIDVVNKLYDQGHTIYIETARGSGSGKNWLDYTKTQLDGWGIKYHKLRSGVKFHADIFVDDKGMSDVDFFSK